MMDTHVKLLGWLYIVLGAVGILVGVFVAAIIAGGGLISQDRTAILVTSIVAAVIVFILILVSVPGVVAGIGLLAYKPWARILTLILGFLNLPGFPVGTALGIYTLYVLLTPETNQLFEPPAS
jgi:hypothetical protein